MFLYSPLYAVTWAIFDNSISALLKNVYVLSPPISTERRILPATLNDMLHVALALAGMGCPRHGIGNELFGTRLGIALMSKITVASFDRSSFVDIIPMNL